MRTLPGAQVTPVLITHPSAHALQELVRRERRRGALIPVGPVHLREPGLYGVLAEQYRPVQPAWVRPFRIGAAVTSALAGAVAAGWWLVSLVLPYLPLALGVAVALLAGWLLTRPRGCTITHHRG